MVELLLTVPNGSVGNRVKIVVADCEGLACDTAVIATVPEVGAVAGAMYNPVVSIMPVEAPPPGFPFTSQLIAVLLLPLMVAPNCRLAPTPSEGEVGLMLTETSCSCTVRVVEAVSGPTLAEISAVPLPALVASPCDPEVLLIVATVAEEEAQFAVVVMFGVDPSVYSPMAVNCSVPPVEMDGLWGLISMAARSAAVTGRLPDPATPPRVALMTVAPLPVLVAIPLLPGVLLTVATAATDELQ